jgi:hypothetical protein
MAQAEAAPATPFLFVDASHPACNAHPSAGSIGHGARAVLPSNHRRVKVTLNRALHCPARSDHPGFKRFRTQPRKQSTRNAAGARCRPALLRAASGSRPMHKRHLLAAAALLGSIGSADAALISLDVSFAASQFSGVGTAPDPVLGTFRVTLDTAQDTVGQTAGIALTALSPAGLLGSPPSFTYFAAIDLLIIGGDAFGPEAALPGDDDFTLQISGLRATPVGGTFVLSTALGGLFAAEQLSVTATPVSVPEPGAASLLAAGLVALEVRRRRRARRA